MGVTAHNHLKPNAPPESMNIGNMHHRSRGKKLTNWQPASHTHLAHTCILCSGIRLCSTNSLHTTPGRLRFSWQIVVLRPSKRIIQYVFPSYGLMLLVSSVKLNCLQYYLPKQEVSAGEYCSTPRLWRHSLSQLHYIVQCTFSIFGLSLYAKNFT